MGTYTADFIIERLKRDAQELYALYKADFDRYDNSEDMHAMNEWKKTVEWLDSYREQFYDWTV